MEKKDRTIIILLIAIALMVVFLYHGVYKMYFQFNSRDVHAYLKEEADRYPAQNQKAVYQILQDGVHEILNDRNWTKQVCTQARVNGTPREMELVHSAAIQATNRGYLTFPNS